MGQRIQNWSAKWPLALGFVTLATLIAIITVWGIQARIAGAIVAQGQIEVESNRQVVQHPDGGVVGEILVRDGDSVVAGQTVLRLDGTFLKSELAIIEGQLFDISARTARLEAERDGADDLTLPPLLNDAPTLFEGQRALFFARRDSQTAEINQITEQANQLRDQIQGVSAELTALETQLVLIRQELVDANALLARQLVQSNRVLGLQREEAGLQGAIGRRTAEVAQLKGRVAELELDKVRLSTTKREEAISDLRDLQFRQAELAERQLALTERLARLDVRAPVAGTVFESSIFALQSVIRPGVTVMSIVPSNQPLIVTARIDTIHVDQVQRGQKAALRFTAFDQRRTPEVFGTVTTVSANVLQDDLTGQAYYQVSVVPDPDDLANLNQTLIPGMPVDAFIQTGERSPLNYLAKPLTDYFVRAFRED